MTALTWISSALGPTTMWVEGRTARDYESQGFVIEEYDPPPPGTFGYNSGRAKIVKPGSECTHVWSPELAALHKHVCDAHGRAHDGLSFGQTWKRLHEAHSFLFNEFEYHETLMRVVKFSPGPLEEPQARVVSAIQEIAERFRGDAKKRVLAWATDVESFKYERPSHEREEQPQE